MKNIKLMSLDELKAHAELLEHFSYDACILAESLLEIAGRSEDTDDSLRYIKTVAGDVAHLEAHIYGEYTRLEQPPKEDIESFVRQMCRLCKGISIVLAQMCNDVFGWTELDIHEVVNGCIEDGDLNEKEQS